MCDIYHAIWERFELAAAKFIYAALRFGSPVKITNCVHKYAFMQKEFKILSCARGCRFLVNYSRIIQMYSMVP